MSVATTVGTGKFLYIENKAWAQFPAGWKRAEVPGIAIDSHDRVFVFARGDHPVMIFNPDGTFVRSWGEGLFKQSHGIFIGPDDSVYCVDVWGHAVRKFTPDGRLLLTIETADHPADTGYTWGQPRSVLRAGGPFNCPTGVALSPEGDIYVSDGYGNARVHKFSPDGRLLFSWGEPGSGPGQFMTSHGVFVDKAGLVYVSDRHNARVQIFDPNGKFLDQWRDVRWPDNICADVDGTLYIAELGTVFLEGPTPILDKPPARVTVRDGRGKTLAEWGEPDPTGTGRYFSPHGIAVDSRGDVYLGEVPISYAAEAAPSGWPVLRKYTRRTV